MRFWQRLTARRDGQPLPAEIYISLVDALFKDLSQPGRGVAGGLHHRAHHGLEDG